MRTSRFRLHAVIVLVVLGRLAAAQESPEQILQQAIAWHQKGDVERAIPQYRQYLRIRPEASDVRSNLGAALASTGRYEEAIAEYRMALKGRPREPRIRLNLALALYKAGRISEAAGELSALHAVQPAERQTTLLLADCRLRQGENGKVIDLLTPLEKQDQGDLAIAYLLGTALLRDKQVARGQQIIDRILRDGDSAEARLLLGTAKVNAMEFNAAIEDFGKALELNPHLPDVYAFLGLAHKETGDMAAARADFQKELEQNPNDFESNLNLAVLLKQDQDFEGARKLLDRALRVRTGDPGVLYQLATIDLATGKIDEARVRLEALVKASPEFVEAHISLATVYYRLKRKADGDREKALVQKLSTQKASAEQAAGQAKGKDQ
jgi:tetratricopeptide (TPR) repeat protein